MRSPATSSRSPGLRAARTGTTLCDAGDHLVLAAADGGENRWSRWRWRLAEPAGHRAAGVRAGRDLIRGGSVASGAKRSRDRPDGSLWAGGAAPGGGGGEVPPGRAAGGRRRRPQVAYRETVVRGVSGLLYRHVKQDGGAGQFAHVVLDVEPVDADDEAGFVFRSAVAGRSRAARVRPGGGGRVPGRPGRGAARPPGDRAAGHPDRRGHSPEGLVGDGLQDGGPARAAGSTARERDGNPAQLVAEVTVTVPDDAVGGALCDLAARRGHVVVAAGRDRRRHRDRASGGPLRLREPAVEPDAGLVPSLPGQQASPRRPG